jgi:hypothetical protein
MNGNPCARAGGAFAYVMANYRAVERKRLAIMQLEMDRIARGILPGKVNSASRRDPRHWWFHRAITV